MFIISGICVLFGLMLGGAAIVQYDPINPDMGVFIRGVVGYSIFMTGAIVAFFGAIRKK